MQASVSIPVTVRQRWWLRVLLRNLWIAKAFASVGLGGLVLWVAKRGVSVEVANGGA